MGAKGLVYLDANVLIPSVTRGLLIIGAVTSDFRVCWSAFGEAEAERHQHERAAKISDLRKRFGWDVLVPESDAVAMIDTDLKDRPHLAAAHEADARVVITENIKDFGLADLRAFSMSVVTPDVFLSARLTENSYVGALEALARGRTRDPRSPGGIHAQEVAPHLPALAEKFASTFGAPLEQPAKGAMSEVFRGFRCIRCENTMTTSDDPLCDSCRSASLDEAAVS